MLFFMLQLLQPPCHRCPRMGSGLDEGDTKLNIPSLLAFWKSVAQVDMYNPVW